MVFKKTSASRRSVKLLALGSTTALAFLALMLGACKKTPEAPTLRIMTWTDYFREKPLRDFEEKHKVKIVLDYFSSNEELLAKVQASIQGGGTGYDLILPSDYMVSSMIRLQLLQPIDKTTLKFLADFEPQFQKPVYDPELKFSIPFAYGVTGIAVNTKLAGNLDLSKGLSWRDLLENPQFKQKATMVNDVREVAQVALLLKGKNWSNATEADIKAAFAYLKQHKANIKLFTEEAQPVITHDECVLCQAFSGDAHRIATGKPEIKFVVPREGASIWSDNFAIPKNAQNVALAYEFMNAMLNEQAAGQFTNSLFYATPNMKARALVYPQVKEAPGIYPDAATFKRLVFIPERPDLLPIADRLWTELKSE